MSATQVNPLAWLAAEVDSHKALSADAYHVQELPRAEAVHAAVTELVRVARLIESGAIPATESGKTCFVPLYQIALLAAALALFTTEES